MSISSHSKFYFGHTVTVSNNSIDFNEGFGEKKATLNIGEYTPTEYASEIARAMNAVAGITLTYSCTFNRSTRKLTLSADGTFSILIASGSRIGTGAYTLMGFGTVDLSGSSSYIGGSVSGSEYITQFVVQDYTPSTNYKNATDATVNKAASGRIEVFKFGDESFIQMNFKFITDIAQPTGSIIRNDASGVSKLITFLDYLITKAPIEFMPDENNVSIFQKVILESISDNEKGVGYKLKELYHKGLPNYYETGIMKFRVQI